MKEEVVYEAIRKILKDEKSYFTSLNYAVEYCRAALDMKGHELYVQCLYILNNISHWRGEGAKEIRGVLKAFKA